MDLITACADIGSVSKGNFAWRDSDGCRGGEPSSLASRAADLLNGGRAVALGFECPLFVPLMDDEMKLTCARPGRPGEGRRPWSAGAGCGALTTGLVQTAWVLQGVRRRLVRQTTAYLDWDVFCSAGSGLLLWEAFVSGKYKGTSHDDDAELAVSAFQRALPDPTSVNAVECASPVYSLVGAALLRTGWSTDLGLLEQPCLVIKVG